MAVALHFFLHFLCLRSLIDDIGNLSADRNLWATQSIGTSLLGRIKVVCGDIAFDGTRGHVADALAVADAAADVARRDVDAGDRDELDARFDEIAHYRPQGFEVGERRASAVGDGKVRQFGDSFRIAPCGKINQGIAAEHKEQLARQVVGPERGQRFNGIARVSAIELSAIDTKMFVSRHGELEHFSPRLAGGNRLGQLMRRNARGNEPHLIEPALFETLFGHEQMPDVDGVECSAEDADAHDAYSSC
jgi:hypothetical protein